MGMYQSPFPPIRTRRLPPKTNPIKRLAITFAVVIGLCVAAAIAFYIHTAVTDHHRVLVDNANDFTVSIEIGDTKLHLAPHTTDHVTVGDGKLEIHATGPNFDERVTLVMPETTMSTVPRVGLYNVGGRGELALVSMSYGAVFTAPPIQFFGHDKHVVLLPTNVSGDIDEAFPTQVESSQSGLVLFHVCHVDGERFKCPGSNVSDAR
jgi:hypothetical protein